MNATPTPEAKYIDFISIGTENWYEISVKLNWLLLII